MEMSETDCTDISDSEYANINEEVIKCPPIIGSEAENTVAQESNVDNGVEQSGGRSHASPNSIEAEIITEQNSDVDKSENLNQEYDNIGAKITKEPKNDVDKSMDMICENPNIGAEVTIEPNNDVDKGKDINSEYPNIGAETITEPKPNSDVDEGVDRESPNIEAKNTTEYEQDINTEDDKERNVEMRRESSKRSRKRRCRRKPRSFDMTSEYSSSDDIPLQLLKERNAKVHDTYDSCLDSEDSYKPSKKDLNSSDSNLSSIHDSSGHTSPTPAKRPKKKKYKIASTRKSLDSDNDVTEAKKQSRKEFMHQRLLRKVNEKRLDNLLFSNGLKREIVKAHGNCFFDSAIKSIPGMTTRDLRTKLCDHLEEFWNLGNYERQKDFVCSRVEEKSTKTYLNEQEEKMPKKRQIYRSYSFEVDGEKIAVCKKFFLATFDIGESYVNHAMTHKDGGVFGSTEKRGKHKPHNKTKEVSLEKIRAHIDSFPRVEGHYTRKDSSRQYLGADLNITKMYELYKEHCTEGEVPVSLQVYRKIFNEEYNLSFHTPKKDQCSLCTKYSRDRLCGNVSKTVQEEYEQHQKRKIRAREEKERDKSTAKLSHNFYVATFDLQAVLNTPCSLISQIYYMRKLNSYNLTFYNLANKNGTCYLWSEVDAGRGSCEIATCLLLQMLSLPQRVDHVIFYSDACTGQNRNQYITSCLQHAITSIQQIKTIDHKFLESGHTQMECDSMHSAIEFAKKKTEIFVPSQWDTVIRMSRRKNPFLLVPLKYSDVWDFKQVQRQNARNTKVDTSGIRVNWLLMKWIRFSKEEPDTMQFKYNYDDDFRKIKLTGTGSKRGRSTTLKELPRKYKSKLAISAAKKKDLNLCTTGIIPDEHHDFYKSLPSGTGVVDKLPEPDMEEEDDDTDQD